MVTPDEKLQPFVPDPFLSIARSPKNWAELQGTEVLDEKRQHSRLGFKVPVMVCDATGALDCSITENVSRSGFCFSSEGFYIVGEVVLISIRCGFGNAAFQAHVRIVRREELGITGRRLYGVYYLCSDRASYFAEMAAVSPSETSLASLPA